MAIKDRHLEPVDLPQPVPGPGEVLVDVVAAGVNRADLVQVAGYYPPPPGASPLPGLEVAGYRRDTGEPVVALLAGGGYAEVVSVPVGQLLPVPTSMTLSEAAGLVEVAATVVSNLIIEVGISTDGSRPQTVFISGGTGGIGTFAIQFAHALGHRVLTSVGSPEGIQSALNLGADRAWDRHTTDIPLAVAEEGGVDVILDIVGGSALADNVRMLRDHGCLIVIGLLGGPIGELDLGLLMSKRARIIGTTLRSRPPGEKAAILKRTHELVWPMLESGQITIPVQARLPLEEAEHAHRILKQGGHLGKVILDVAD